MLAADLVVTLGEAMRDEIEARGVPAEKVEIVPNAVSAEYLRPLPDATTLREELGIKPDEPVVGEVTGRLEATLDAIRVWAAGTESGDRAELPDLADDALHADECVAEPEPRGRHTEA